jgi:hypothetical protein
MKFSLGLCLVHPAISGSAISCAMGIRDKNNHRMSVGDLRMTPKGTLLKGTNYETKWSTWKMVSRRRDFFVAAIEAAKSWEPSENFYREFADSGGEVNLNIGFGNSYNLGDDLSLEHVEYLRTNQVTLGLEIFPGVTF